MVCIMFKVFKILFLRAGGTLGGLKIEDIVHNALPLAYMYAKYICCVTIRTNIMLFRVNKGFI